MTQKHRQPRTPLSLEEMSQGRFHTLSEARELFDPQADERTLRRWIWDLQIPTYKSPIKGHSALIAHADLVTVAKTVGRALKRGPRHIPRKETQLQRELETLQARYDRDTAALKREIEELQRRLGERPSDGQQ